MSNFFDEGSLTYDNLIAGSQQPLVTRPAIVVIGEAFSRGALLARVTATGKWKEANHADTASYDGYGIATSAVDSTGGEQTSDVFIKGEFAENAVSFFYGNTADDWREQLLVGDIILRKTISVLGQ